MLLNQIYEKLLVHIYQNGETRTPRNLECREIRPYQFTLEDITDNVVTLPGFETNKEYAAEELKWYLSGNANIDYSPKIKKVWEKYSDDGTRVNSNYGERIFGKHPTLDINQWDWVKELLTKDPDTRQAVVNINSYFDKDKPTKDFPCTLDLQFFNVNGKLEMITHMRSNDVYFGLRNDLYCFTELQKKLATELGLAFGAYTHIANSMHLYKQQYEKVERLIK